MANAQHSSSLSVGSLAINQTVLRSADHPNPFQAPLPAGKAGTLSTRTDNDTGVVTATAHGLAVNDKVDLYWSTSGNIRYGMTVTNVADANTATIDGGAGDNLPVLTTAVVIVKQVNINSTIDGDAVSIAGICAESTNPNSTSLAHVHFLDANGTTIAELDLVANVPRIYDVAGGSSNPFAPSFSATFTAATDDVVTSTAHGLSTGHQIKFTTTNTLPAGLSLNTWYFVTKIDADTFNVSATLGGAAIDISSTGTGTHTWTRRNLITQARASNGNASEDLTLKILSHEDSTP